jgi:hypothetical protein
LSANKSLETVIELGVDDELKLRRPTRNGMTQDHHDGCLENVCDVEMENEDEVTPRPRDFQRKLRNADDIEVEPYETPLVLKKARRQAQQVVEGSDTDVYPSKALKFTDVENRGGSTAHSTRLTSENVC